MRRLSGGKQVSDPPTWYLGRMFLNKYQFVFDGDNKKVGFYKMPIPEEKDTTEKTDEIITDDKTTDETDKTKTDEIPSDSANKTDIIPDGKTDVKTEPTKNKPVDIVLIIVFSVVSAIIIVAVIVVLCKCLKNKEKRKKRANELIDEEEYSNDTPHEEKAIN